MPESNEETWAPVPGYEGLYEVSDQGRVRSLSRDVYTAISSKGSRRLEERILTQRRSDQNATVQLSRDGNISRVSVGRLVLLVHGPDPKKSTMQAQKINPEDPLCLRNLEWRRPITQNKLTEEQAATIYKWAWGTSMTNREVGEHFRVSQQTVSHIKHGRVWSHVTDDINRPDSEDGSQPNQYS